MKVNLPCSNQQSSIIHYNNAKETVELTKLADSMFDIINKESKRKIPQLTKDVFKRYILTIQAMNQHPEHDMAFIGVDTNLWNIPYFFANLVFPARASLVNETGYPSMIDTDIKYVDEEFITNNMALTYEEFEQVSSWMLQAVGLNDLKYETMSQLRLSVTFSDVMNNLVEDGRIHYMLGEEEKFYFYVGGNSLWNKSEMQTKIDDYIIHRFAVKWRAALHNTHISSDK